MNALAGATGTARRTSSVRPRVIRLVASIALATMMVAAVLLTFEPWNPGPTEATEVTSYTVRPGDTLWAYAERITPQGGDVAESVDLIMRINHMDSAQLEAGQRILVPKE
ncbi:LysM peptidoglycan-binding domain-containing protein [Bifidobacterium amazonense]|uniref:LysM peptidoglycan-binding domain-containing protein n=1 Tax=Bifidobacterium amazonense TaxID=2809027 RepID=A0ABS9VRE6_9BIFI|nr:LysM peptidoglycan-binding domain-containing protein [Bifidobacterium amazonense]MCH9274710.1 LysM peptidoglycan-binding domain-containing protein [Bifidobacterium amazonense]